MATPVASVPVTNLAPLYFIPCGILAVIAFGLCAARTYTRAFRARHMYIDDWLIVVAEILSFSNLSNAGSAAAYGWGRPYLSVSQADATAALKRTFAVQVMWIITIALVRISVASSLLRFGNGRLWKGILWTLIVCQILTSSGWMVVQFFQCRPLRSMWEPVGPSKIKCWKPRAIINYGWFSAAFYCTMDLILALMPIKFIRKLTRPLTEKILIGCLMAMGLLVTGIAGAKMTTFEDVGAYGDLLQGNVKASMWAKLEEEAGIIAACMPCLKSVAERCLHRLGIFSTRVSDTKPSFVQSVSLHNVSPEDQITVAGGVEDGGKMDVRVDSMGVGAVSTVRGNRAGKPCEHVEGVWVRTLVKLVVIHA
ncbi:hypothetical protein K469DRAFT_741204 [Zopfia rhizophila CBS 207.26]|uniref:Rhodopsin domain-containing protein n=1 Tax=Zopfia rhizophila CBS 207.26 TaxID=1314779 RepID=A0A6A6DPT7_9PEZI|nr:hypothetical protein K469DRAFT_741204 [Zopfia rhizophila CBS 207.26]